MDDGSHALSVVQLWMDYVPLATPHLLLCAGMWWVKACISRPDVLPCIHVCLEYSWCYLTITFMALLWLYVKIYFGSMLLVVADWISYSYNVQAIYILSMILMHDFMSIKFVMAHFISCIYWKIQQPFSCMSSQVWQVFYSVIFIRTKTEIDSKMLEVKILLSLDFHCNLLWLSEGNSW